MIAASRPKLIYLVTEDWYFWSHRLPMARAARAAGFEVAVATRVTAHGERIRAAGFALHPLRWRRRSLGPWATLAAILEIWRLYRREQPLVVTHVALKPAMLGGVAALLAGIPSVVSIITGTGYIGASGSRHARLVAQLARLAWPRLLLRGNSRVIVQNEDDRRLLAALRPDATDRIILIPGSGVDTDRFQPVPEPPVPPVAAAYVGRMIAIKGVGLLVEAQQKLRQRGAAVDLLLAGAPDPENPTALDAATLARWQSLPGIRWLGHQEDVRPVWAAAHIALLASRGEGLPKTLLEAAAMGRPIVATDTPGTRDIARAGVNALLVPPDDPDALAEALARLAADAGLRRRLGAAGRRLVETDLSDRVIGETTAAFYHRLLGELGAQGPG